MARLKMQRDRTIVAMSTIRLLWPLFRRSEGRNGWVLRIIGDRVGPVLILAPDQMELLGPEGWSTPPASPEDRG